MEVYPHFFDFPFVLTGILEQIKPILPDELVMDLGAHARLCFTCGGPAWFDIVLFSGPLQSSVYF